MRDPGGAAVSGIPCGALSARNRLLQVMPRSAITFDHDGGVTCLYAVTGSSGPAISAGWLDGRYARGRVGRRSHQTQRGFLNAVSKACARSREGG